jgi:hypothetical protein
MPTNSDPYLGEAFIDSDLHKKTTGVIAGGFLIFATSLKEINQ